MKENFLSMPIILKFITAHAVMCIMFLVGSVIPHNGFSIDGQPATYYEWWSSGAGIGASIIGVVLPFAAWHILNKTKYARHIYVSIIFLTTSIPYLFDNEPHVIIYCLIITGLISWYLFGNKSVVKYFTSNKALKSQASPAGTPQSGAP